MRRALLGILISLPVLFARPMPYRWQRRNLPPPTLEELLDSFGLKSAERQKILDMWIEHEKDGIDIRQNIDKMQADLKKLLLAKRLDEKKILEMAKKIGEAEANQRIKDLEFKLKLLKLVPDKHKDEFKEFLFFPMIYRR